jgi:hypothetical protein
MVPLVVALSFRLLDMGNGVDRVEGWSKVPFDEALAGANEAGVERLTQPTPPRVLDAVGQVLGALGIKAPAPPELLVEGYSKVISERVIDVVAWMALLV